MSEATTKRRLREDRFVAEYLKDFSGSDAIRRCGFIGTSADVAASKLLARPRVRELLAKRASAVLARADVSVDRIVQEAAAIAFSDPRQYYGADGVLLDLRDLPDEAAAALADLEFETVTVGEGDKMQAVTRIKRLKRWNKNEAIRFLGQYKGMTQPDAPAPISVFNIQINL